MKKPNQIILKLNELLAINSDAEKIYLDALNQVEDEALKNFFRAMAFERNEFCRFLGAEILQEGGEPKYPEHKKHISVDLWSNNLTYIATIKDEYALLDEVCNIKSWSIKKYHEIIDKMKFPENTLQLLIKQRNTIENSLNNLKISESLNLA
ncbi:hypothetical protein GCM10023311_11030 [Flaviramulus aquimarinus]|uniref:DUF2383 domain-containing protein n=1 Tax=Flaviramulus aquimarinus TaxID=1170456 RepID=A0ABP9F5Q8_9FLAO